LSDPTLCSLCPRMCRYACPVASGTADETATPTSMMQAWREAQAGRLPWKAAADAVSRCTGCMACSAPCEFDQDLPSMLYEARAEAWKNGAVPAGAQSLHKRYLDSGNPFGEDLHAAMREHADEGDFDRKGRVLFWPGCRLLEDAPDKVATVMAIFRALGADHISLPARKDTPCCGAPLRAIGDEAGFQVAIAGLQQYFNRQRTLITASGDCLNAITEGYGSTGNDISAEVLHLSEYLTFFSGQVADLGKAAMDRLERLDEGVPSVIVFDSCSVRRRAGRGDAIYDVLEAATGSRPTSFGTSPDRTVCCGAGDFHDLRRPEAAAQVAAFATAGRDLPEGAWVVATDPSCVGSLRSSLGEDVRVDDLVGFLAGWLGPAVSEGARSSSPLPTGLKTDA
jgi:Fe-S oxidoreductase